MWLLPFARVSLDSNRSSDELLATLQRLTRPPRPAGELRFIRPKETATFVGQVSKEYLEFCRALRHRNSFVPFVIGRIVDTPTGARIEAVMRPHTIVLVFMSALFALLTPFALLGIYQFIKLGAASEIEAVIPIAMWAVLYPMCMIGFIPEARKIRRLLDEIVTLGAPSPA